MQDSLPAGGLRLCRAGVEPTGSLREVSDHLIPLPRAFPGAITVRPSRGIVRLAREVGARSRPVSGQRGRSPPPPARTITDWPNAYRLRAGGLRWAEARPLRTSPRRRAPPVRPCHRVVSTPRASARRDPPLATSRLPVSAQRETRPRFPGPPLRAVRRRGTLIRSRVRHRCTIVPRGEKP